RRGEAVPGGELDGRPGVARGAGVLGLDADGVGVAQDARPVAYACVVGDAGGDDVDGTGAAEPELGERAREVGSPIADDPEAGVVALRRGRGGGVMVDDAGDGAGEAAAPALPAVDLDDLQPGVAQDFGEPSEAHSGDLDLSREAGRHLGAGRDPPPHVVRARGESEVRRPRERLLGGSNQHSGGTLVGVPGGLLPVATNHLGLSLDDGDLVGEFADAVRARHGHEHVFEGVPVEVHVIYGSSVDQRTNGSSVDQRTNGSPTSTAMSSPSSGGVSAAPARSTPIPSDDVISGIVAAGDSTAPARSTAMFRVAASSGTSTAGCANTPEAATST